MSNTCSTSVISRAVNARQVHLVDQRQHRNPAHAAHGDSLRVWVSTPLAASMTMMALSRPSGAIGIFGEILVAGRVQQVHHGVFVGNCMAEAVMEMPRSCSIPINPRRCLAALAPAHHARSSDQAGVQEKLFGQRRLPASGWLMMARSASAQSRRQVRLTGSCRSSWREKHLVLRGMILRR